MSSQTPGPVRTGDGSRAGRDEGEAKRLAELRQILRDPEWEHLLELRDRLRDPTKYAHDVGRVLPSAITLSREQDAGLDQSLGPVVEASLIATVRREPKTIADAIFPVIGPAIRKYIANALSGLVESINQGLNHALTPQGLRWRWEAFRTGSSFGEVVLRHSMVYRVEQVFLIHKETGLLLEHVMADATKVQPPEMVAAMLTAIQDFAKDSFRVSEGGSLNSVRIGDFDVWVEEGPDALLAAAISGVPPHTLREEFQSALEDIHATHGAPLDAFDGDASAFASARPRLEECLRYELGSAASGPPWAAIALFAGLLLLLAWWLVPRLIEGRRWAAYHDRLQDTPGLVVTDRGKRQGKHYIAGLRDPLAPDPQALLDSVGLDRERVESRWEPYVALSPPMVLARARERLAPPQDVQLDLSDGVITATGAVSDGWARRARALAPTVPGVTGLRLADPTLARLETAIEDLVVGFAVGADVPEERSVVEDAARRIRELDAAARARGRTVRVAIVGSTDDRGDVAMNVQLARLRAERVQAILRALGVGEAELRARGSDPMAPADTTERARAQLRQVGFTVDLTPPP